MTTDDFSGDAYCQDLARNAYSSEVYCNTALPVGAPFSNHGLTLDSPSVNGMVQVPRAGDAPSPHPPAVSFQLAVAGPLVLQETRVVREVEIGPGITLADHSTEAYKFIMSLVVIEEED